MSTDYWLIEIWLDILFSHGDFSPELSFSVVYIVHLELARNLHFFSLSSDRSAFSYFCLLTFDLK
ncbi:hypothetical protein [Dapis sp. BLCC M229]|uniref:hypothetical protein n=1 Tax=Dapis sp. BLCC M229 TaxID=3400188 RepID=UPI003CEE5366